MTDKQKVGKLLKVLADLVEITSDVSGVDECPEHLAACELLEELTL